MNKPIKILGSKKVDTVGVCKQCEELWACVDSRKKHEQKWCVKAAKAKKK